ncbi:hypothetical protein IFM89_000883 [Coptis chinensis]|uniref:Uncharacterized protein n=1 Tax=Coptis chinensis TaxID=261450 RepID=A0A835M3G6_9MAGN|nr:hypothetical protein IFM89_000883 [Coptis chinensis]
MKLAAELVVLVCCVYISLLIIGSQAQQPTTDPSEVRALNSIFRKWGTTARPSWNRSGEPCSGAAVDSTDIDNPDFNPGIKCNCVFDSGRTCHITRLYVPYYPQQ